MVGRWPGRGRTATHTQLHTHTALHAHALYKRSTWHEQMHVIAGAGHSLGPGHGHGPFLCQGGTGRPAPTSSRQLILLCSDGCFPQLRAKPLAAPQQWLLRSQKTPQFFFAAARWR